jgi:hypothetical protein
MTSLLALVVAGDSVIWTIAGILLIVALILYIVRR